MCAPFGEDPSFIKGNWRDTWSKHKVDQWDKWVAEKRAEMMEKGWDPNDPKSSSVASGFTTQVARWQWSKRYDEKYNTPGQGVHGSGTGRQLDDPSVTAPQAGAAASGRDQNLGAGGGTNPQSNQSNQNNPDTNTNQSNKDKAGSKKASKKENLKIPKPDVNLPNGNQSSGGVNY